MGVSFDVSVQIEQPTLDLEFENEIDELEDDLELLRETGKSKRSNIVSPSESMEQEFFNMLKRQK